MRIILLTNIKGLGLIGDIKVVRDGYARNFLLPKRLVLPATEENLKKIDDLKKQRNILMEKEKESAQGLVEKLKELNLVIYSKSNDEGTLYAGIDQKKIAEELKKNGIVVDQEYIKLADHLKNVGEHSVIFEYSPDIQTEFKINIIADKNQV
ncbi:MAG: 50S ribosomal protein L9 [Parcubacteria group bacterium]|nr:50S ribosomal protein L9 [Parcubacteria group bacterium]